MISPKKQMEMSSKTDDALKAMIKMIDSDKKCKNRDELLAFANRILKRREKERNQKSEQMEDFEIAARYIKKRENAISRGIEFTLTLGQYKRLMLTKRCYYTGVELKKEDFEPHYRTVDRFDSQKGYTKENCVACSGRVNSIKNHLFEMEGGSLRLGEDLMIKMLNKMISKR